MEQKKESFALFRGSIILASIVIIIAGLKAAQAIVAPLMVSIFVATTVSPFVLWLTRHRVPAIVAVLIVVLVFLTVGAATGTLVGTSIDEFTGNLPFYEEQLKDKTSALLHMIERVGIDIPEKGVLGWIDPGAALSFAGNLLKGFGNFLANAFLIMLIAVFMLLEVSEIPVRIREALGRSEVDFGWFGNFTKNLRRYLAIKTWVSLATGLCVAGWLSILGVDFPFLWGLLAFLLNYVPNIGSIIAAVPAVLLSIIQLGWGSALLVALGYVAFNLIFGTIVEPRFLGRGLGLSTLIVFLSLIFWGWVLGTIGLFLSVPLTMTAIIALKSNPETQWIAIMLGSNRKA
jgi:predicted PurR-regulated permease PerM